MGDKSEIISRFRKSVESYDDNAPAQKEIAHHLYELAGPYLQKRLRILEIGCGTGFLTRELCRAGRTDDLYINDLVEEMCCRTAVRCGIDHSRCMVGDVERLSVAVQFDLIVSASTFQWFSCPSSAFARFSRWLSPGGLMIFSTFGKDNLRELTAITGKGLHYYTIPEMTELLSSGFEVLHAEESLKTLSFPDPLEVLRHLKKTGVNAVGEAEIWTRQRLNRFAQDYETYFSADRQYPLTYHPTYFICRKLNI